MPTEFSKISETLLNSWVSEWRGQHKPVVGFYCTYVPEEILYAAGILPFRVRGTGCKDTALADAVLSRFNCSFIRCTLNLALEGKYDFLDGMACLNSCDHARRMYDIWKRKVARDRKFPVLFFSVPHHITDRGLEWMKSEVAKFREDVEKSFEAQVTDEGLRNAIKVYNESRKLLKELYELRKKDAPPITGTETLQAVVAGTAIPKDKYNQMLREFLKEIDERKGIDDYRARLMIVGSVTDDPPFLKIFEDVGGLIVTDSNCYGTRYFWDLVDETGDPMDALAARYYHRIQCPRMMDGYKTRFNFIKERAKDAKVDGVILQRMGFCDTHGCDNMLFQHELEDSGIPALNLDREYLLGDTARFKTRVEAFLERIGR